ncbi:iron-containing alcohol dehydrogenase [Lacrimispora saccharolytica]|nr:iron-containing alcohol dehydrogenase [Lacrimispora saccharolytica]
MNRLKKAYCRTYQTVFKLALPFLPYRTPEVVGSVKKLPEIILREKCGNVLHASYYAGCAFTKSYVGYVHAVAHSLGGEYNVPHGYTNAVLLPYVLQKYGESIHKKLSKLAVAAGICTKETPCEQAANAFIDEIKSMKQRFGIGNTIPQIREEDIPKLAHYADKEANPLYPVPVLMDAEELETFYHILMEEDYEQKEEHAL